MRQIPHEILLGGMLLISTAFTCVAHADAPVYNAGQYDPDSSAQTQAYNQNDPNGQDAANGYAANANNNQANNQNQNQNNYQQADNSANQNQYRGQNQGQQNLPSPNFNSQMTLDQRVVKLEQQVANLNRANLNGQLQNMQQELQDLHGQLELQAHQLAQLRQGKQADNKTAASVQNANSGITDLSDNAATSTKVNSSAKINAKANANQTAKAPGAAQQPQQQANGKVQAVTADNADFLQQQNTYESAYNFIKTKEYTKAIAAMKSYLLQYHNGQYAPNAHYWLGELYYIQNNIQASTTQFETVVNNYPDNDKVGDAKLKLGFIYFDNGQLGKAKELLTQVAQKYPGTTVAQLAQSRLREIKRLGQ